MLTCIDLSFFGILGIFYSVTSNFRLVMKGLIALGTPFSICKVEITVV